MDRANGLPRYRVGEIAIIKSESMAEFMGDYFDEGIIGVHSRVDCDVHRGKATTNFAFWRSVTPLVKQMKPGGHWGGGGRGA